MNDLESRLQRAGSRPLRELRSDFTDKVFADLTSGHERPPKRRPKWKEYIQMKIHKPVFASLAAAVVLTAGGTAYAAVNGWDIHAMFGGERTVADGRIVTVTTDECTMPTAFTMTSSDKGATKYYYRVKAHSKLTNQQIVQTVRGNCNSQAQIARDSAVVKNALDSNPLNKNTVVGYYLDNVITAITPTSISVRSVIPMNSQHKTVDKTFSHIAADALVYSSPDVIQLSDLKVGDHVSLQYRATGDALAHSETLAPDQIDGSQQTVVTIIKLTADTVAASDYQKYNGNEFEQVVPCGYTADGYCNVVQYYEHKK
jgi:hypothetical protein